MAESDVVASAIVELEADTSKLESGLRRGESMTSRSARSMSASMSKVEEASGRAGQAVGVLGAAAAVTGNASLAAAASIGSLGAAVSQVATLIAGPVGLAVGAAALGAAFVALAFDIGGARTALTDWIEGVGEANEKAAELEERLKGITRKSVGRDAAIASQLFNENLSNRGITGKRAEIARLKNSDSQFGTPFGDKITASKVRILERELRAEKRAEEGAKRRLAFEKLELEVKKEKAVAAEAARKAEAESFSGRLKVNRENAVSRQKLLKQAESAFKSGQASSSEVRSILGLAAPTATHESSRFGGGRSSASFGASVSSFGTTSSDMLKESKTTNDILREIKTELSKNQRAGLSA